MPAIGTEGEAATSGIETEREAAEGLGRDAPVDHLTVCAADVNAWV